MAAKKNEEFMIVNRRTGKALQASGTENGQTVVQAAPTGNPDQLWAQEGKKFINKASGKALDVVHGGVENGTWAHIWDNVDDAPSQDWEPVKVTATYKKLRNVQSGKVLDIVDMSEDDGALAQIWDDVDGVGQQWKFVPAEAKAPSKTVTRTTKKPAVKEEPVKEEIEAAKEEEPAPKKTRERRKAAEAVKETADAVKEAVKEVVAKPVEAVAEAVKEAVKEPEAAVEPAKETAPAQPAAPTSGKRGRRKGTARGKK